MTTKKAPTEEEVRAAEEILARRDQAEAERREAAMQPVAELVGSKAFADVAAALAAIDPAVQTIPEVGPHLIAFQTGLEALRRAVG